MSEYDYADKIGKPVLPIVTTEEISANLLPPPLLSIQSIDYIKRDIDAVIRLSRALTTAPRPKSLLDPLPAPPDVPTSPLVIINEQIKKSELGLKEQNDLVLELEQLLRNPEIVDEARGSLEILRRHNDLRHVIAPKIDLLLGAVLPNVSQSGTLEAERPQTFRNSIDIELVLVSAGEFQMGEDKGLDNERPVHQVQISPPFYLGKYPVTQAQWETVMGNNPSEFIGDQRRPVERVSWDDVQEFIRRLNKKEGLESYRLPTEAEWEYAARAGSTTKYCFGDDESQLAEYAWYDKNSAQETHPVGQLKPNAWDLYDMHGNVWEWVQDWYAEYTEASVTDPQGPSSGSSRIIHGSSWLHDARSCRSAVRGFAAPGNSINSLGVRVLRMVV
jgi:formylglycine-generating enzyme required for sulfatase activity